MSSRRRLVPARLDRRVRRLRARRLQRNMAGPRLIDAFAVDNPEAFFVEIGANDGEQHDHLRPFILDRVWSGIMVEPVPYVFERLRKNYGDLPRVILENAAIGNRDGEMPFYYLVDAPAEERASLPDWYDGIGSFSRDAILSHARQIPDVEERLVETPVRTMTFETLCDQHAVSHVDLLLIDTEGYDGEIVHSIDFSRRRPQLLVYEHYHLEPRERLATAAHLRESGYETMEEGFDTFCVEREVRGSLRAAWETARPAVAGVSKHDERQ